MPQHQSQQSEEPTKRGVKRKQKTILKNVVSLRVSDKEKQVLEKITQSTSMNVSEIFREAIESWLARHQRLCR